MARKRPTQPPDPIPAEDLWRTLFSLTEGHRTDLENIAHGLRQCGVKHRPTMSAIVRGVLDSVLPELVKRLDLEHTAELANETRSMTAPDSGKAVQAWVAEQVTDKRRR